MKSSKNDKKTYKISCIFERIKRIEIWNGVSEVFKPGNITVTSNLNKLLKVSFVPLLSILISEQKTIR